MEQKSQSATSIELTPSVQSVVTKLGQARVTSWRVVQVLLELHGEYGRNRGQEVRQGTGPADGRTQLVARWIAEVSELFDPDQVRELHGRLLVLGLCRLPLEQPLAQYLGGTGFLAAVQDELREDFRSLLTAAAAGPEEQYRGDFLRIVQNRGKLDDSSPMRRAQGFVVIAEQGRRLADLAALTQRQSYNRCYTARYVLPQRQTLAHGLQRFVFDLMALESGKGTIEGDLLPDPVASVETWKPLLKERVKQALSRQPRPSQQTTPAPAEIGRLRPVFDALGDEAVLGTGLRLILLFEFRGGVNGNVQGSESVLDRDGIALLSRLPERIGIVVSGFAAGAKAAIVSISSAAKPVKPPWVMR